MSTNKIPTQFTPRGTAIWPKLDQPYKYDQAAKRSVPDRKGNYEMELALEGEQAAALKASLQAFAKEQGLKVSQVKNWPFREELEKDTDEPTGRTIFKFKQYGETREGTLRKIPHFDAKSAKPLPSSFRLTTGSEVIVAYKPKVFTQIGGGLRLGLYGVQVVKYVERDGNPGFAALSDGFDYVADSDDEEVTDFPNSNENTEENTEATDF